MGAIISWGLVAAAVLGGFLLTRFKRRKTRQLVEQGMRSVNPVDLGSPVSANGRIEGFKIDKDVDPSSGTIGGM